MYFHQTEPVPLSHIFGKTQNLDVREDNLDNPFSSNTTFMPRSRWPAWDCGFIESKNGKLFRAYAQPNTESKEVVMICNALGEEAKASFGVLSNLANLLWSKGWSIVRFDYSGTGDSEGTWFTISFQDWLNNCVDVLDDIKRCMHPVRIVVIGVRLGANIAAKLAATQHPEQLIGLVLWAPILNLQHYERHLRWENRSSSSETDNGIDHFGWILTDTWFEDMRRLGKLDYKNLPCPALIANISGMGHLSKDFINVEKSVPRGSEVIAIRSRPFWNLIGRVACPSLIEQTTRWLSRLGKY